MFTLFQSSEDKYQEDSFCCRDSSSVELASSSEDDFDLDKKRIKKRIKKRLASSSSDSAASVCGFDRNHYSLYVQVSSGLKAENLN